jgi:hypothetical protein
VDAAAEQAQSKQPLGSLPAAEPAAPAKLPSRPSRDGEADNVLGDYFTPEEQASDGTDAAPEARRGSSTADGNRVFRIRSVASFCDEADRLARCLQDGDLLRAAKGDADAPVRLRLALNQLRFVTRALEELAQQQGWPTG